MDREIDELFLGAEVCSIDQNKIRNLEECMESLPKMYPNLRQVQEKCREIHSSLELYTIKLESLANDMRDIETENARLESDILQQTAVYEHIKDLLMNVEIKEDHFVALETESFDSIEGLCRMEKALDVLNGFRVDEYDIRIVREKREQVNNALRGFYKRFITHMGKYLVRSGSTGELKVHKALYDVIRRFKAIFKSSRRYRDYYSVICSIYIAHSKKLYEREFGFHLKTVSRLLKSSPSTCVHTSLGVLLESYRSIVKCEKRFLETMEIDEGLEEVFKNTSLLISDFVEETFELYDVETLDSLQRNWKEVDRNEEPVYYEFQESLRDTYRSLESGYLDRECARTDSGDGVVRLEGILAQSGNKEFNRKVVLINIERIMASDDSGLKNVIRRWQLIHRVSVAHHEQMGEVSSAEKSVESAFEKECIGSVLGDEESKVVSRLKSLLELAGDEHGFRTLMIRKTRSIVLDNVDGGLRREVSDLLSRALNA